MRKTSTIGLAVIAVLGLVLSACGSDGSDGPDSGSGGDDAAPSLDGTQWVLTAMEPAVAGTDSVAVSANFVDGGVLSGHSGCNTYRTTFEQDGVQLTIGQDIATTKIACPPGPSRVEQEYLRRLVKVESLTASGSTLTLRDASEAPILEFRTAPTTEDLAGDWDATSFYTGTALSSPIVGTELTATFADDKVSGSGGCNTFSGSATTDGSDISIGPLASTMMACTDEAKSTQEQQYLQALELANTFEVVGDRLSLFREDGGYAAVFERA
jgi:heat shock protein HslJ